MFGMVGHRQVELWLLQSSFPARSLLPDHSDAKALTRQFLDSPSTARGTYSVLSPAPTTGETEVNETQSLSLGG